MQVGSGSFSILNFFSVGKMLPHGPQLSENTSTTEAINEESEQRDDNRRRP